MCTNFELLYLKRYRDNDDGHDMKVISSQIGASRFMHDDHQNKSDILAIYQADLKISRPNL